MLNLLRIRHSYGRYVTDALANFYLNWVLGFLLEANECGRYSRYSSVVLGICVWKCWSTANHSSDIATASNPATFQTCKVTSSKTIGTITSYALRYVVTLQLYIKVFIRATPVLMVLMFFCSLVIILTSSLIFFAERGSWDPNGLDVGEGAYTRKDKLGHDGELTPFLSIIHSMWWSVVTFYSVG